MLHKAIFFIPLLLQTITIPVQANEGSACVSSFGDNGMEAFVRGTDARAQALAAFEKNGKQIAEYQAFIEKMNKHLQEDQTKRNSFFWFMKSVSAPKRLGEWSATVTMPKPRW